MKLTWTIAKKRGNWRPILSYTCEKEDWEMELAIPGGDTALSIPAAFSYVSTAEGTCFHGTKERGGGDWSTTPVKLRLPNSDSKMLSEKVLLPWRLGAHPQYDEVKQLMQNLLAEWETRVLAALSSGELEETGEAKHTEQYLDAVVAYITARRMLK